MSTRRGVHRSVTTPELRLAGAFSEAGDTVYMVGRDEERLRQAAGRIRGSPPAAVVIEELCDVSDLDAVRSWCTEAPPTTGYRIGALMVHGLRGCSMM